MRGSAQASLVWGGGFTLLLSVPAASVLAMMPADFVNLLHGNQWDEVIPLVPWAAAMIVSTSIYGVLSMLLVANDDSRVAFWFDLATGTSAIGLAIWLVSISVETYLIGLTFHGLLFVALAVMVLNRHRVIFMNGITSAFSPALFASMLAALVVDQLANAIVWEAWATPWRLTVQLGIFGIVYILILRIGFANALRELLHVAPGGQLAARLLMVRA